MADFKLATEIVDLPSKGYLYSKDSSLADGKIEIKYMTAKEEDILTNSSYIQKGTVLDKLFQSLIVSKIDYNELLIGDKNTIMIAARILGYGKDYAFTYEGVEETVDLTEVNNIKNIIDDYKHKFKSSIESEVTLVDEEVSKLETQNDTNYIIPTQI